MPAGQGQTVNDIPTVHAYLYDKDIEDSNKVRGQFTLHWANNPDGSDWGAKWTSALTQPLTSGPRFQIKLPSTIPENTRIGWGARASDGTQYSAWSYDGAQQGCYFYYSPAVPGAPTISSQDYPTDAWRGGVGEPGRFVIADSEQVAALYRIKLNGVLVREVSTTAGAQREVELAPEKSGVNILEVEAIAPSGQKGPSVPYEFRVNAGADPVARFTMDEGAGATAVASTGPGRPARLHGAATLGGEGETGTALTLDGTSGYAESTLPVVDTTESFTVSAWVKPSGYAMANVLAQDARFQSAFQLGIGPQGKPVFKKPSTDTEGDGGGGWQQAIADTPLPIGQWSHLTGVYDNSAGELRLYVDGQHRSTADAGTPLESHGALQIGRSLHNSTYPTRWPGSIDDVHAFTQALTGNQAEQLHASTTPSSAGHVAHWSMNEPAGKSRVYSTVAPWKATLHGNPTLGAEGQAQTALQLDNPPGQTVKQYAATERPVVNTLRSFAVSAWVKVDGSVSSPSRNFTAVSARGEYKSGFYLKYTEDGGDGTPRWVFARTAHDSADTGWYQATSKVPARTDEWTHVVGVYDSIAQRMKIYVNGEKGDDSPVVDSRWLAKGGLEIGRSQWAATPVDHWAGQIDDLRVYDRVVGQQEANELVKQHPVLKARWALNPEPVDESFEGPAGSPGLSLHNGAAITDQAGIGWAVPAGLKLNPGSKAFAESTAQVIDPDRSFTLTGWIRPGGLPQHPVTVWSQPGQRSNVLSLRYVPGEDPTQQGNLQVEMRNEDDAEITPLTAVHRSFNPDDWNHVTVVYDALRDRVSLYVGGELYQNANGVSEEGQILGFATQNSRLQVGRSKFGAADGNGTEFWPDAIDDIWVYQGVLTPDQIALLAAFGDIPTEAGP
ncbi:hypothetical protein GCM10010182_46330 [Actinomadura cremea]|nr:hypothetical protein GCM10010182_46330 [Actinomadura cremea]